MYDLTYSSLDSTTDDEEDVETNRPRSSRSSSDDEEDIEETNRSQLSSDDEDDDDTQERILDKISNFLDTAGKLIKMKFFIKNFI